MQHVEEHGNTWYTEQEKAKVLRSPPPRRISSPYFPPSTTMSEQAAPAKSPGGVGAVKCTYPSCTRAFRSVREMKNHKRNDPEHDYCNKCDVDCDSWDDFVEHKANANPKVHIACLHCGQDFKSIPGRNRHIAQVRIIKYFPSILIMVIGVAAL